MFTTTRPIAVASAILMLCSSISLTQPISRSDILPSYDYIVVGGGTSGLTVANRLSEDSTVTVLVIEAGPLYVNPLNPTVGNQLMSWRLPTSDANEDFVRIPGLIGGGVGSQYDWNISYAPNDVLGDRVIDVPQGKVVGGSTVINYLTWVRGSRSDYNRWETLGFQGWNWDSFLQYFKKTESFTPATSEIATEYNVTYDATVHGQSGNVHSTFSPFYWPTTRNYVDAYRELGIRIPEDQGNGDAYGG
ncbi:MAG: hypothetical protein M1820_000584 [Bogoriella megaspora]|nr:MAG: hypothetical protein M1820_000584 [Bogoriella megaspora]